MRESEAHGPEPSKARAPHRGLRRPGTVALATVILLCLVSAGSSALGPDQAGDPEPRWAVNIALGILLVVAVGLCVLLFSFSFPRGPSDLLGTRRRLPMWATLLGMVVVVALFFWVIALADDETPRPPQPARTPNTQPTLPSAGPGTGGSTVDWVVMLVTAGVIIGGVGVGVAVRRRARPWDTAADEPEPPILTRAAAASVDALEHETDPRRAVILAYLRMEAVFAAHGLPRAPAETPTEYLDRVFVSLAAPIDVARILTERYEWARFAHHPVTPAMRAEALAALRRIDTAMAVPS